MGNTHLFSEKLLNLSIYFYISFDNFIIIDTFYYISLIPRVSHPSVQAIPVKPIEGVIGSSGGLILQLLETNWREEGG